MPHIRVSEKAHRELLKLSASSGVPIRRLIDNMLAKAIPPRAK